MKIRELALIDTLQPVTVLTGESGMNRTINNTILLEYDFLHHTPPETAYHDTLVITTLHFVKSNPAELLEVVKRLIDLGAAALAIKSESFEQLPENVIQLANANSFPILQFCNPFIEDTLLCITDHMQQRQEFSDFEAALYQLILGNLSRTDISLLCKRMHTNRKKYLNAVYVHSNNSSSDWGGQLRSALQRRSSKSAASDFHFFQFRHGVFVLSAYTDPIPLKNIGQVLMDLFANLGLNTADLCFGVGSLQQRSSDFDCAILDAFEALLYGILNNHQLTTIADTRLYKSAFTMVRDHSTREIMQKTIANLSDYDTRNHSCLIATLDAYTLSGYNIKETAVMLHQHPNTVRYRLNKIRSLTAALDQEDYALYILGEFRRIDHLSHSILYV